MKEKDIRFLILVRLMICVAMRYGFQRFRPDIMPYTVIILIVMVQIIQSSGNFLYKITKK